MNNDRKNNVSEIENLNVNFRQNLENDRGNHAIICTIFLLIEVCLFNCLEI